MDSIAIVGMDCRVPGATNVFDFWDNLKESKDSIRNFTKEELLASGEALKDIESPHYVARRGIVDGADMFDAAFFGFTPREAELLDPQHRLFLECCWHALEDAGYAVRNGEIRVGVFGGAGTAWYLNDVYNNPNVKKYADPTSIVTASDGDYLATRVSYKLNLNGPSLDIQSACSSAMASIVLGVQSLLAYQSDLILAGGVSVQYPEKVGYLYSPGGLDSADGVCRPFDKQANGTLFSRGCGVLCLKRLDEAIRDKDQIYAVIRSGALNNDGNKKVGFTAPSVEGQKEVICEALELAGVSAEDITMVEAHGTATPVGDPIEVTSLSESFRYYTNKKQYCALGSVKSNIGHTDAASGVIAVIKTALALKYKKIPASIHYSEPNPKIDFENSPFFVNTQLREWHPDRSRKRMALVNSFGVGGTNACVILEEAPVMPEAAAGKHAYHLMALSTMQKENLPTYVDRLKEFVEVHPELDVSDMAYTSLVGRKHFKHRVFVSFRDRAELLARLDSSAWPKKGVAKEIARARVFMFPGQGNQYLHMGRDLYRTYPVFREVVDKCAGLIKDELGCDIRTILYPETDETEAAQLIDKTFVTQPAIFIISYAQASLLLSWGIQPDYLIGHSVGEYVAAALSGVFSLEDALKAVTYRARLVQELPGGAMCAVLLKKEDLQPMVKPTSSIAVINYSGLCTVSGPFEDMEALEAELSAKKVFHKRIPTSHAFHSPMMEPMLGRYRELFDKIRLQEPEIPIISTVTGRLLKAEEATSAEYWVQHVRKTVCFSDAVTTLLDTVPAAVCIEVGPGQSLESAVKRHLEKGSDHLAIGTMRTPNMKVCDTDYLATALGNLWLNGVTWNWERYYKGEEHGRCSLPLYPYNRKSYIVKPAKNTAKAVQETEDVRMEDISEWTYLPSWKKTAKGSILLKQSMENRKKKPDQPEGRNSWLILEDECGIGMALEHRAMACGEEYVVVRRGDTFLRESAVSYMIDMAEKEHYDRLLAAIKADGKSPNRVIHLWNVEKTPSRPTYAGCVKQEEAAYYSALYLEQAFINQNMITDLNLLFVANGVYAIGSEAVCSPLKSLAVGPARSIHCEMKQIFGKFVDVDVFSASADEIAEQLMDEAQFRGEDHIVVLRKNVRWTEWCEKVKFPAVESAAPVFKDGGTYLVTGGTGGLGLVFARHIAGRAKANIILNYRTALPAREEWDKYLKDYPGDITTEKIKTIRQIEAMGSTVYLFEAETNDPVRMQALKDFADKSLGGVDGVIHSAGAAGGGVIALKTKQMSDDVLKVKTRGTLLIDEIFGIDKLDFVVYFSSLTALLGESSRVDYCSANTFLDNYAFYRNQIKPGSTFSINWDSWSKVGMAARWKETQALTRKKLYLNEKSYIPDLHLVSRDEVEEVYQIGFDGHTDWVYKEHRVAGQWTIVGTFLLDVFTRYALLKYPDEVPVISDVYFLKPLFVANNEHPNIRVYARPDNGRMKLNISVLDITRNADKWDVVATATVGAEKKTAPQTVIPDQMAAGLGGKAIDRQMFEAVEKEGHEVLRYSPRWLNIKTTYRNGNRFIVEQELNEEYAGDFGYFTIHPSLLDTTVASLFAEYTDDPFLPFTYQTVKVYGRFTPHIYALVDVVTEPEKGGRTAVFDLHLYNEKGELILEANKYALMNMGDNKIAKPEGTEKTEEAEKVFILPEEGTAVFDRILHYGNGTNVIVSPYNVLKTIHDMNDEAEEKEEVEEEITTYDRPDLSTDYVEPTNEIEKMIAKIWGQILGIGQIGLNDNFNELGGNSLLVVQAVSNISSAFNIQLPVDAFRDGVTVKSLAENVMELLVQDMDDAELETLLAEAEA